MEKSAELNHAQGEFARKKFAAGFLGGETGGQTRHPSGAVAGVLQFLRGKKRLEFLRRFVSKQLLDARNLDGVNAAPRRLGWLPRS